MDRSCTWRWRRTCGRFEDCANKKIKLRNQRSKHITEGHYFLGPPNTGTVRLADFVTPRRTHTYKALYFLCNVFCVSYLRGHCKKLSWQNVCASQAEEPATSTLGICHTSLPPFYCLRHSNNKGSTTLAEQTRPNPCQQKTLRKYCFVVV